MSSKRYHSPLDFSPSSDSCYEKRPQKMKMLHSELLTPSSSSSARYSESGNVAFSNRHNSSFLNYYPTESPGYMLRHYSNKPHPVTDANISRGGSYNESRKPHTHLKRTSGSLKRLIPHHNPYYYVPVNSARASHTRKGSTSRNETTKAAAAVSAKIKKRAAEERMKRMEYSQKSQYRRHQTWKKSSLEQESLTPVTYSNPTLFSNKKEKIINTDLMVNAKERKLDMVDGHVAVILDEVGGNFEEDGITKKNNEKNEDSNEKVVMEKPRNKGHDCDRGKSPSLSAGRRTLLKLYCQYCHSKSVTFKDYSQHLRSHEHTKAMNNVVIHMRNDLSKLRKLQRDEQRKVEKEQKTFLSEITSYCRACELNFRTDPKEHEATELHKDMKRLVYQRCEICNVDFRIWKVYLYHMAALEHVKQVAMKELKESEGKEDAVKGTNFSQGELGTDLIEIRTVLFCKACVRYLPIKGGMDETKERHCITPTHLKKVEELRQREKKIVEKQQIRMEREVVEKKSEKIKEAFEFYEEGKAIIEKSEDKTDITTYGNKKLERQESHKVIDEDEIVLHAEDDVDLELLAVGPQ